MPLPRTDRRYREEEYLELEKSADSKSEFFDGEIFAVAGASFRRTLISMNLGAELNALLRGKPCTSHSSDLKVKSEPTGLIAYPDVSVICGPPVFAEGTGNVVTNPTLLAEVLSDSTEAYDRGAKFELSRHIPALREYLLVSQRAPRVERFLRQSDGAWIWSEATGLNAGLDLPSLGLTLSLANVFAKVAFEPLPKT